MQRLTSHKMSHRPRADGVPTGARRQIAPLLSTALAMAFMSCLAFPAVGDDAGVGSGDDGWYEGTYVWADQKGSSSKDTGRGKERESHNSITERPEDIPMYLCDGERAVGSPLDCPSYVPPPDLDQTTARQLARHLVVRLQLPKPTPQFGPDPSDNEWNMIAVGYPLWLWTDGPTTVTATESAYGYTFTLRAHYRSTTFELGDGTTTRCTDTTRYRRTTKPGTASPTCGHTYLEAARDGTYTVSATTHWDVDWSVAGFSGTLPGTHSASRELRVGELQAIVVG